MIEEGVMGSRGTELVPQWRERVGFRVPGVWGELAPLCEAPKM